MSAPATGTDEGTTSPCNGDSGGPLVAGGKIVGIVSWGVAGCTARGAYPVFTKVSSYTWAAQPRVDDSDLSAGTKRLYRFAVQNYVLPGLGELRLREVTVPRLDHVNLRALA